MSRQVLLLVFVVIAGGPAYGQQLSGAAHEESAPGSIAEPIRALLGPGGVRVTPGNLTLDFWWVTSLPVKAGGEVTWLGVAEGTVVGAVRLSGEYRDVRGKAIRPGVYTLRYGIQPANGDHLGVSTYRDFLLLSPVADDLDPAPTGHDGTVAISKDTIGGAHPATWALDPPVTTDAPLSVGKNDMDLTYMTFEVPTSAGTPLRFGLVLIGRIDA